MSPLVLIAMLLVTLLTLVLPRRWILTPFLVFTFLTPVGQQFNLGGLHIFALRIVILVGCLRAYCSKDSFFSGGFNPVDKVFVAWVVCRILSFVLLYREGGAVINQLGFLWESMGGYLLLRYLIRDEHDIRRLANTLVIIAVFLAVCMIYERLFMRDVFGLFMGGRLIPDLRNGKARAQGPFSQSILAGAFGGTISPMFVWLWKQKAIVSSIIGLVSSIIIAFSSGSSTGISALLFGVLAFSLWPLRRHMRAFRWGIVAVLLGLALVMKAPIWFVLARVDFVGGSTGWDRANLIDLFVRHFSDWWLIGTADYPNWSYFSWDQCNQFVAEGENGGLASLVLFIMLLTRSFRALGITRKLVDQKDRAREWLVWTLGALLCAHIAGFFGISYFDHSEIWWFASLAMVSAATINYTPAPPTQKSQAAKIEFSPSKIMSPLLSAAAES